MARGFEPPDARYLFNHRGHFVFVKPEERRFVTAELIRRTTFTATEQELKQRVAALRDAGWNQLVIPITPGEETTPARRLGPDQRIKAGGLNTRPEITVIRRAKATASSMAITGSAAWSWRAPSRRRSRWPRQRGRLGRHPQRQPCRRRRGLCRDAARARHDRALFRGRQRQPPAALGRHRHAALDQPDRGRGAGIGGAAAVLDMATTVAAYGKVKVAAQQGKTMPEGWMIDRRGQPLTDPNRADDGFLLPIGGYKGAALALMFGLLAGTLNGAANGDDVVDFNKDDTTPTNTGQAICVLDIKAFAEPTQFKRQVDAVIRQLHGSALLPGFDHIRLPGEDRHRRIEERRAHGIPIPPELRAALDKLAADLHSPPLFA
jgi:hypothetical protein